MSHRYTIRLNAKENEMLQEVCKSEVRGDHSAAELFRLLLHREYNRRKGLPAPNPSDYQGAFRTKPRKESGSRNLAHSV